MLFFNVACFLLRTQGGATYPTPTAAFDSQFEVHNWIANISNAKTLLR